MNERAHVSSVVDRGYGLTVKERYYLNMAESVAASSDCKNQHGAVIVQGGRVVSKAANKFRNHPSVVSPEHVKTGCSVHAEVAAIKKAGCSLLGAKIFVARVGKFGPLLSRPCNLCYNEILNAGITDIIHT